jgi:hypothetical protein
MDLVRHTLLGGGVLSLPDVCSCLTGRLTKRPAHRLVKQAELHALQHLLHAFQRGKKQFPGSTRNTNCAYITDPEELVEIIYELRIHHQRSSEKARNRQVSLEALCQRIDDFLETFPQTFPDLWAGHDIKGLYTERGLVIGFTNNFTTSSTDNGQNDHTTNVRFSTTLCRYCFLSTSHQTYIGYVFKHSGQDLNLGTSMLIYKQIYFYTLLIMSTYMRVYQGGSHAEDPTKHATPPASSTPANIGSAQKECSSSEAAHTSATQVSCTVFLLTFRNCKWV